MPIYTHFHRIIVRIGFILLGVSPLFGLGSARGFVDQEASSPALSDIPSEIQGLLEGPQPALGIKKAFTVSFGDVKNLYERVGFKPLWFTDEALTNCAHSLREALGQVAQEGLEQSDYDWALELIAKWSGSTSGSLENQLRADILLSQVLLQYISDVRGERLSPKKIDKELFMDKPVIDEVSLFLEALKSSGAASCGWLEALPPQSPEYRQVREELHRLLKVKRDSQDDLYSAKDKAAPEDKGRDHAHAQKHKTLTVEEKIQKVVVTMERLRWMPDAWGNKYLLVNIPAFKVKAVDQGKEVFSMPIIVGKSYRETPVFTSKIINLIVNPSWHVPRMIAVKDKLPIIKKRGPGYLTKEKIHVYKNGQEVSPSSVNWSALNSRNFDLNFRQDPGSMNALGRIRFTIPNSFSVYLHGTPKQNLFDEKKRAFSSGCIRLEDPDKMAVFVLEGNSGDWTLDKIKAAINTNRTQTITLDQAVPTYLQYLTVVFNEEGEPTYLEDIYGQDKQIGEALKTRRAQGP